MNSPQSVNQFDLLRQRRFAPFFGAQFLGAFNDNLFKFAVTLLITYHWHIAWLAAQYAGIVIGAVFILPFVIFSSASGQLADNFNKARIFQLVKAFEVVIMSISYIGFRYEWPSVLLLCIFLMGLHSTLFGPAKYAYLPEQHNAWELMGANALVEAGTFLAILLGNLGGGLLIAHTALLPMNSFDEATAQSWIAFVCITLAVLGLIFSLFIPVDIKVSFDNSPSDNAHSDGSAPNTSYLSTSPFFEPKAVPSLIDVFTVNPLRQSVDNLSEAFKLPGMKAALYGISWMWFYGAVFLSLFPIFSKDLLHASPAVASLFLFIFSLGIGFGALLCEAIKHPDYELGLVVLGLLGMSAFTLDLAFNLNTRVYAGSILEFARALPSLGAHVARDAVVITDTQLLSISDFLRTPGSFHLLSDLALLALFAGIFSVPLYTFIQVFSPPGRCAQIIAANNILNALLMVLSAVIVGLLLHFDVNIPQIFLLLAVLNAIFMAYLCLKLPTVWLHFYSWVKDYVVNFKNPF